MQKLIFLFIIPFILFLLPSLVFGDYEIEWADTFFAAFTWGLDAATDANGNIYVAGMTAFDGFIVKYRSSGEMPWPAPGAVISGWRLWGVTIDKDGDIIVAGTEAFNDTVWWYIAKHDTFDGSRLWADTFNFGYPSNGGATMSEAQDVVTDASGNFYVTGYYEDNDDKSHMYTRKYNSSNTVVWQDTIHNEKRAFGIALDPDGNFIITGSATTIKYSSAGDSLWARTLGLPSGWTEPGEKVATDASGNIYVPGHVSTTKHRATNDCLLAKYNPAGTLLWSDTIFMPTGQDEFFSVAVDDGGKILAVGHIDAPSTDWFVVEYTSSGTEVWRDTIDNGSWDHAYNVTTYGDSFIVTGMSTISGSRCFTVKYNPVATAVELLDFEAIGRKGFVDIRWMTEVEVNNYKWLISRSTEKDGSYKKIVEQDAKGKGPNYYTYTDLSVVPNRSYWYKLGDMDTGGKITWHGPVNAKPRPKPPFLLSLSASYPNPTKSISRIEYQVSGYSGDKPVRVKLMVYNIAGQLVKTLVNEQKKPGYYTVCWDGKDNRGIPVAPGSYFYRLEANGRLTDKLIRL